MSAANVEVVRVGYEVFGATGRTIPEVLDPEVEWHTAADLPDSGVHRGHEGIQALLREWTDSFEDFRAEVEDLIDRGDCVIASVVLRGRIRGSHEEVALPETHVWKLRDGKVVEVHEYRTLDEALAAVEPR